MIRLSATLLMAGVLLADAGWAGAALSEKKRIAARLTGQATLVEQGRQMVLPKRIELLTSPLPRECSTTELRQPEYRAFYPARGQAQGAFLRFAPRFLGAGRSGFGAVSGGHENTKARPAQSIRPQ